MTRALLCLSLLFSAVLAPPVRAADPRDLKWADLVPTGVAAEKPRTFFSGSQKPAPQDDNAPPPPPLPEGKFMEMKRRQPGSDRPPEVVQDLNGQRVKIGGYVVPLDFEQTSVKEFLLVPFVGACIHVPPPPANQIIYVKAAEGFELTGQFDPVSVVGKITTEPAITGLADTGYTIAAESVTLIPH